MSCNSSKALKNSARMVSLETEFSGETWFAIDFKQVVGSEFSVLIPIPTRTLNSFGPSEVD